MNLGVRQTEKSRRSCKKTYCFFHRFFMEMQWKLESKNRKPAFATEIDKKNNPWGSLFSRKSILGWFLVPRGYPKFGQNLLGSSTCWDFGAIRWPLWASVNIFRFWRQSGCILGPSWLHFKLNLMQYFDFLACSRLMCFRVFVFVSWLAKASKTQSLKASILQVASAGDAKRKQSAARSSR